MVVAVHHDPAPAEPAARADGAAVPRPHPDGRGPRPEVPGRGPVARPLPVPGGGLAPRRPRPAGPVPRRGDPYLPFAREEVVQLAGNQPIRDALEKWDVEFRRRLDETAVDALHDYHYRRNELLRQEADQRDWDYTADHLDTVSRLLVTLGSADRRRRRGAGRPHRPRLPRQRAGLEGVVPEPRRVPSTSSSTSPASGCSSTPRSPDSSTRYSGTSGRTGTSSGWSAPASSSRRSPSGMGPVHPGRRPAGGRDDLPRAVPRGRQLCRVRRPGPAADLRRAGPG